MTLYRQLAIFTLILIFIMFAGAWSAKLQSTRSFLLEQLESHAQDTATSLGLSISQHNFENDMPVIETMINAVFDRGYYRFVRYEDARGKIMVERELGLTIENVPSWFIRLFPLKTHEASANVMAGWHQAGTITVKSHPGYAYKTLWQNVVHMTVWFLGCTVLVLIAGGFGLRLLLKPLVLVERQADALCKKKYEFQERLPKTKELRRVVEAMNRMTGKVKEMFEEQVAMAEGFRKHAYHDSLTGLGNRRYFESQLHAQLAEHESPAKGFILLFQINDLQTLNRQNGLQAGDVLLQRVATLLQEATKQFGSAVVARLTGGDFSIFVPNGSPWDAETIAEIISGSMKQLAVEQLTMTENVGHIGGICYDSPTTIGRLLSEADLALRAAQQAGPNKWNIRVVTGETAGLPLGKQQWKDILGQALSERNITLFAQPVVETFDRNRVLHLEIFSRIIQEDGVMLSAGLFIPFAEHLQLVSSIDRIVFEDVMKIAADGLEVNRLAVNISPASLHNDSLRRWLTVALENLPKKAPRLNFEFVEFGAAQNIGLIKEFSKVVRKYGHFIGLDHYGQGFSHLGYLKSLRPDYVKIDRAYIGELKEGGGDSKFFISSLCSVAHSLDITVIAEGVETELQWQQLKELNIDAIQGYIIEKPKPFPGDKEDC